MTSISEAIEIMGLVAACHYKTAPRMDDREVTLATAKIWAELFGTYNLEASDLKAAVMKRATAHAEAPEPAEIIKFAREIRRERAERETTAQRQHRENAIDAKAEHRKRIIEQFATNTTKEIPA